MAHLSTAVLLVILVLFTFLETPSPKALAFRKQRAHVLSFVLGSVLAQIIAAYFQAFEESNPAAELLKTVTRKLEALPGEQSSLEQRQEELEEELRTSKKKIEEEKSAILNDISKTTEESASLRGRLERTYEAIDAADDELAAEAGKLFCQIEQVKFHMKTLTLEMKMARSLHLSKTKALERAVEVDKRSLKHHRDLNKDLTRKNLVLKKQLEKQKSLKTETSSLLQEKERLEALLRPRRVQ